MKIILLLKEIVQPTKIPTRSKIGTLTQQINGEAVLDRVCKQYFTIRQKYIILSRGYMVNNYIFSLGIYMPSLGVYLPYLTKWLHGKQLNFQPGDISAFFGVVSAFLKKWLQGQQLNFEFGGISALFRGISVSFDKLFVSADPISISWPTAATLYNGPPS